MSNSWSIRFLAQPGSLSDEVMQSFLANLEEWRYRPLFADGLIHTISGDGFDGPEFDDAAAALRWIARSDGLVPFEDTTGAGYVDVSVSRADGALAAAFEWTGDEPHYDQLALHLSPDDMESRVASGDIRDFVEAIGAITGAE